jgi:hypothetical protein
MERDVALRRLQTEAAETKRKQQADTAEQKEEK